MFIGECLNTCIYRHPARHHTCCGLFGYLVMLLEATAAFHGDCWSALKKVHMHVSLLNKPEASVKQVYVPFSSEAYLVCWWSLGGKISFLRVFPTQEELQVTQVSHPEFDNLDRKRRFGKWCHFVIITPPNTPADTCKKCYVKKFHELSKNTLFW